MNKKQLKEQLYKMNVPMYGNRIKRNDVERFVVDLDLATEKEVVASLVPLDIITKVAEAIKNALKKGKSEPDLEKLNTFVKSKTSDDLMDLAKSAIDYFKQGKLEWEDGLNLFQNQYQPGGYEIIPWSFLKRQFNYLSLSVEKRLPRAFVQHLSKASTEINAELLKVFAGEVYKLSQHPKYRRELQKRERDKKNKEILERMSNKKTNDDEEEEGRYYTNLVRLPSSSPESSDQKSSKVKRISDDDLSDMLDGWYEVNDFSAFTLAMDRCLFDYALDYIVGAGGISKTTKDPLELGALVRWKRSRNKIKFQEKQLLRNVEIWDDKNTGETLYLPNDKTAKSLVDAVINSPNLVFYCGYDAKGDEYNTSSLSKSVG
jgi:hypothetical protein